MSEKIYGIPVATPLNPDKFVPDDYVTKAYVDRKIEEVGKSVLQYTEQPLTEDQKDQVRKNIGAGSVEDQERLSREIAVERSRINTFTSLGEGSTTGDAELQDIRVGYDGTTYETAGKAVREQFNDMVAVLNQGKNRKTITDSVIVFSEKEPSHIATDFTAQKATLHGVNHFDLASASFATNSYSASHTITKENGGIKVACTVTDASAYLNVSTSFIAPFTGLLYCSCEADCDGDIRDVIFMVSVNGVNHTKCYGKGQLYQAVSATKGDTIKLSFYTHVGTSKGNTVYYKNIQCAYGGLYEYSPYTAPITNAKALTKAFVLPAVFDDWYTDTTHPDTSGLYRFTMNAVIADMREYPASGDTVPKNVSVSGAALVPFNAVYNGTEGVGIAPNGRVSLLVRSVQSRNDLPAYLESHPIVITYEVAGAVEYVRLDVSDILSGSVLEFEAPQKVTYFHKPAIEKKYACVCFGDSITGMFADKTDYPSMMEVETDLVCHNAGFSGTLLTDHPDANYQPFSMNRLAEAVTSGDFSMQEAKAATVGGLYPAHLDTLKSLDFSKVDFVTIFYGTNDFGYNRILKAADDTATENKQRTNVEDALKYSISTLLTAYPHLRIIVLTPYANTLGGNDSDVVADKNGVYLIEYADHIQKVAEESYHVPTINLYRTSGVNTITNRYFTQDGVHPTELFKHIIASRILRVINENK